MKLCKCGCGQPTPTTNRIRSYPNGRVIKKGEQMDYIKYHYSRTKEHKEQAKQHILIFNKSKPMRTLSSRGYVILRKPDHPYVRKDKYIFEHRLTMSEYLNRKLDPREIIHHINGDITDNRIENLKLMTIGNHARLHLKRTE